MNPSRMSVIFLAGVLLVGIASASELTLVRNGVGLTGHPVDVIGTLDLNGNGHPELLVARPGQVSLVEEVDDPRGYREIARLDGPPIQFLVSALNVQGAGIEPALLLCWANNRCELRRHGDFRIKATITNAFHPSLGDVDGDGQPEIVVNRGAETALLDPGTLQVRASFPMPGAGLQADILGDARNEIVLVGTQPRAFSISRSGNVWTATEVWNSGLSGAWMVLPLPFEGRTALVLHDGLTAMLATFGAVPAMRTIESSNASVVPIVADANSDGQVDLITASQNMLRALDVGTGALLWERDTAFEEPRLGFVSRPVAYDLDGDGAMELAWGDHASTPGVVTVSMPPIGSARWRSDFGQMHVIDWTMIDRGAGDRALAHLSMPGGAGAIGIVNATTLADEAGSAHAWWLGPQAIQAAGITSFATSGNPGAVVVGSALDQSGTTTAAWLWYFNTNGEYVSGLATASTLAPERVVAAQVLARPERQLIIAGNMPPTGTPGPVVTMTRVEVVDADTGNVLWQSVALPANAGSAVTQLEAGDLDGDGQLEIVVADTSNVTVLKPSAGTGVVATHPASHFSLLAQGPGQPLLLATLDGNQASFYAGVATVPTKQIPIPEGAITIAMMVDALDDITLFATGGYSGLKLRRYDDGEIVASYDARPTHSLRAIDLDGNNGIEIVGTGEGLFILRLRSDRVFHDGFDG